MNETDMQGPLRSPPSAARKADWWWLKALVIVAAIAFGAAALAAMGFEWREVAGALEQVGSPLILAVLIVGPVFGFPVSLVYLVAGARYGPLLGLTLVTIATAAHLLATYWIGRRVMRAPLQRWVERRGHRLPHVPEGGELEVGAMIVLAPGIPYPMRNYLLALSDVPLRKYFVVALLVHVARSGVAIFLGDLGHAPSRRAAIVLGLVYACKLAIFALLLWHFRARHLRATQRAADDAGA